MFKKNYSVIFLLTLMCLVTFLIMFSSVKDMELLTDEYTDMAIVSSIINNPNPFIYSSDEYKSHQIEQMRFPFYLSAFLLYFYPSISILRLTSITFAILTIIIIYFWGRELKSEKTGILAALLLSISLYYIAFSRFAMTTGDSIFVFFYTLSNFLFFKGVNSNSKRLLFASAIFTGIAIASKLFGIFLIPIHLYFLLKTQKFKRIKINSLHKTITIFGLFVLGLFVLNFLIKEKYITTKLTIYFISLVLLMFYTALIFYIRTKGMNLLYAILNIGAFIVTFTFAFSPTHLSTFAFYKTFEWVGAWNYSPLANSTIYDYVKILFIKLHFPINLLFLLGLTYLIFNIKNSKHNFLFLSFIVPFIFLSLLKWKLTWHMMFLLPLVYLIASNFIIFIEGFFSKKAIKILFLFIILILSVIAEVRMLLITHPYYELDGYQYGLENVGWNKASFLSTQKRPQTADFVAANVPENSTIGYFYLDYNSSNRYSLDTFRYYTSNKNYKFISLNKDNINKESYDYAVIHFYAREFIKYLNKCTLIGKISHVDIDIYYVYKCKP